MSSECDLPVQKINNAHCKSRKFLTASAKHLNKCLLFDAKTSLLLISSIIKRDSIFPGEKKRPQTNEKRASKARRDVNHVFFSGSRYFLCRYFDCVIGKSNDVVLFCCDYNSNSITNVQFVIFKVFRKTFTRLRTKISHWPEFFARGFNNFHLDKS